MRVAALTPCRTDRSHRRRSGCAAPSCVSPRARSPPRIARRGAGPRQHASTVVRAPSEKPPRSKSVRPRCSTSSRRSRTSMPVADNGPARAACRSAPCARRSGMITRKPSRRDALRVAELDPVHLRVGEEAVQQDHRPCPARHSRQASSTPSEAVQWWVVASVMGDLPGWCHGWSRSPCSRRMSAEVSLCNDCNGWKADIANAGGFEQAAASSHRGYRCTLIGEIK